jgi:hypothetical protein
MLRLRFDLPGKEIVGCDRERTACSAVRVQSTDPARQSTATSKLLTDSSVRGVQHRWDDADRGILTYLEKTLTHCYFVHHKSHTTCCGIEEGTRQQNVGVKPPEPRHGI